VKLFSRNRSRENERGQVVLLVAVCFTVMLLFMALAIDVGFAYVTKAKLSKAVDAACLTAMRNPCSRPNNSQESGDQFVQWQLQGVQS
jgi:Flp pilus assembly protein TadG